MSRSWEDAYPPDRRIDNSYFNYKASFYADDTEPEESDSDQPGIMLIGLIERTTSTKGEAHDRS